MIAELRSKSQVTIPKPLIEKLGLSAGDKLEIFEDKGMICIIPVVVYPNGYVDEILEDVEKIRRDVKAGLQPVFNNVDDLIASLNGDDQ
ncbi:MAG: AbrB/MazE/SpoVT family DNA-binding domain-containing protein [Defluviitaleaceae bacterium]|nr:AbrB/MazE/SpoVT family DNA-binding domain-containing protein [Defluviitaleaceae bacterium]